MSSNALNHQEGAPTALLAGLEDPQAVIAHVQRRVLRGMVWSIAGYAVLQMLLWHTRPQATRPPISYVFETILLTGLALQFLGLNRFSIRQSGLLFVSWLGVVDLLIWVILGPQMATAIALMFTILVALFFINKRAGAAVVVAFGLFIFTHAILVGRGILPPYPGLENYVVTTGLMLRAGLSPFGMVAIGYSTLALIHHVLFQALSRMAEERRRRDQAEATMRASQHFEALGKLASGVAHDVNNALTTVLGNAELLKLSLPKGEQQMFAQDIMTAARSAAQTTRQLLSLNRHSGRLPVRTDPVEVALIVSRLVGRLLPEAIRLQLDCASQRCVMVDPADLQQALLNLLLNARDALPQGGVISLRTEDAATGGVNVIVSDTGRGITPDVLPRIFEPFFTTKPSGQGTGLGLAMVHTFAEAAGGRVSAANLPAGGAAFTLSFPDSPAPIPTVTPPPAPGKGWRILLVEDQPGLRHLLLRLGEGDGYQTTGVASLGEALQRLRADERFDLLCTDVDPAGSQTHELITAHQREHLEAPVLLCTGLTRQQLVSSHLLRPGVQVLHKPFTSDEFLARVRQWLPTGRA